MRVANEQQFTDCMKGGSICFEKIQLKWKKIPGRHQVQPSKENQEVIKLESKNKVKYSGLGI